MDRLPLWIALIALLPAVAAFEQRQSRARPWLVWLSLAGAVAVAIAAIAYFPAAVGKAVTIFALVAAWSAIVIGVLAAVERIPAALRSRRTRPRHDAAHERRGRAASATSTSSA